MKELTIEGARETLNIMVGAADISLCEGQVLELSQQLDDLINLFYV